MKLTHTQRAIENTPKVFSTNWKKKSQTSRSLITKTKPKRIIFVGTGSSYHVALWACWARVELGITLETIPITSWEILARRLSPGKGDLLVFISHRGKSGLTAKLCSRFSSIPHILISAVGSPHDRFPQIETVEPEKSNAHTVSLMGAMNAVLEILAAASKSSQVEKNIAEIRKIVLKKLNPTLKQNIFFPKGELYFIGAGIMSAIALEATLKAKEMGRVACSGYLLEEFLHGPSIALQKNDLVILLNTEVIHDHFLWEERVRTLERHCRGCKVKLVKWAPSKQIRGSNAKPNLKHLFSLIASFVVLYEIQKTLLNQSLRLKINPDLNPLADE